MRQIILAAAIATVLAAPATAHVPAHCKGEGGATLANALDERLLARHRELPCAGPRALVLMGIMRCLLTAHDTQEGGPVPPQRPSLRQKNRSPQLFCKRLP